MKILMLEPDKAPYVKDIEDSLEAMQDIVGGYIEAHCIEEGLFAFYNEDGKLIGLKKNKRKQGIEYVGTVFISRVNDEGDHEDLTQNDIERMTKMYKLPDPPAGEYDHLQPMLDKLFTGYKKYPLNSMTPSLSKDDKDTSGISMLIVADDMMIQDFMADKTGKVDIMTSTYLEDNENKIGKDLVIRVDFYYPTGHPIFEASISGDNISTQKHFVNALREVDKIPVWVVNKDFKIIKVMLMNWDAKNHEDVLGELG